VDFCNCMLKCSKTVFYDQNKKLTCYFYFPFYEIINRGCSEFIRPLDFYVKISIQWPLLGCLARSTQKPQKSNRLFKDCTA